MGFGVSKTSGIKTNGVEFKDLRSTLLRQGNRQKVSNDAELRWTAGKGLYVKDRAGKKSGDPLLSSFGSSVKERGDKFLNARAEIARSINLSYSYKIVAGKDIDGRKDEGGWKWIGDAIVDQVVTERAREQVSKEWAGFRSSDADINPEEFNREVEKKKREICLRYGDINIIANKLRDLVNKGVLQRQNADDPFPTAAYSVGYKRDLESEESTAKGTDLLLTSLIKDIMRHEYKKGAASNYYMYDNMFADDQLEAYAKKEAVRCLIGLGMRQRRVNGEKRNFLPGALTQAKIEAARASLKGKDNRDQYKPIEDKHTLALLYSIKLPDVINESGDRILAYANRITDIGNDMIGKGFLAQIADRDPARRNGVIYKEVVKVRQQTLELLEDSRDIIRQLKMMRYDDAVVSGVQQRGALYERLIKNVNDINNLLYDLYTVSGGVRDRSGSDFVGAETDIYHAVQSYCSEMIHLAEAVRPRSPDYEPNPQIVKPFEIRLFGVFPHTEERKSINLISSNLLAGRERRNLLSDNGGLLYEKGDQGRSHIENMNKFLQARLDYIEPRFEMYLGTLIGQRSTEDFSEKDRSFVNEMGVSIREALDANEIITADLKRRQKIFGEVGNEDINYQVENGEKLRKALLLMLYPRQIMGDPKVDYRQSALQSDYGPRAGQQSIIEVNEDDSASSTAFNVDIDESERGIIHIDGNPSLSVVDSDAPVVSIKIGQGDELSESSGDNGRAQSQSSAD